MTTGSGIVKRVHGGKGVFKNALCGTNPGEPIPCDQGMRGSTGAYLPQSHASKVSISMSEQFLPEPALDVPIVFVDLETTGGSTSEHRITEVGVVEAGPA